MYYLYCCGWSGGAMVLGQLPVPGRPTIWITLGQGPTALTVGAGGGCLDIFILIYPFSPLSPSLWETARYRLKYCLKGPLNPKQPTNQIYTVRVILVGAQTKRSMDKTDQTIGPRFRTKRTTSQDRTDHIPEQNGLGFRAKRTMFQDKTDYVLGQTGPCWMTHYALQMSGESKWPCFSKQA